ncbi:adenylosuccinate lyase [Thermocrinis albus DSM 14484]|uniref:Adenylosuccinate lyase n=1 Tax=Thermocrinis albus (strain DSM 14484 / JCM 11386 / HI 11/12) TaxID=638303 RepID=D3SPR3_THEAH|nr:adenylosuccinate lyase [Thermocrinis albus]ADC89150.1 adenylosuccinate lyase [Thermocrinis albus DSM 14484]
MIERYTRKEMGEIWSELNKFRLWLKVELAVCRGWQKLGKIPPEVVQEIERRTFVDEKVISRIKEYERVYKHDVLAFISAIGEQIPEYSHFFHMGLTSSDVVDTALALQLRQALDLILKGVEELMELLKSLALLHKNTVMMGRTHGVHAEPITLGLKFLSWHEEMARNRERLQRARENISYGKLSGAVGTYSNLDPRVEYYALQELGLQVEPVATQVVPRDRHAEVMYAVASTASALERFATEIRHLQRTEVLELMEPFQEGQRGSSAMPHKKNPIHAERICGLARVIRANLQVALENIVLWHERDISHSSAERIILPDSTIALDYMIHLFIDILKGIKVFPDRMRKNMDISYHLYGSSKLLVLLMEKGIPRDTAYSIVQECAMRSWEDGIPFEASLMQDERVNKILSEEEIKEALDPSSFLKNVDVIYQRVLKDLDA